MSTRRPLAACLLLGLLVACKKDSSGPEEPGGGGTVTPPPVTVGLTCGTASGTSIPCDIQLGSATAFRVTLVSTECKALANVVRLTKPTEVTLTTDACHEPAGKFWDFTVPANSVVGLQVTGGEERSGPQLDVDGSASPWLLRYEDGYDSDYNDIILRIEAL